MRLGGVDSEGTGQEYTFHIYHMVSRRCENNDFTFHL